MDIQTKTLLLYEWNAKYDKLDFAITEVEFQLASVNKRLRMLWYDLGAYIGMIVLPGLFLQLLSLFPNDPTALMLIIIRAFRIFLGFVYVFSLPFTVAYLIKSIMLLVLNSESRAESEFFPPVLQGVRRGEKKLEHERTYRLEQKKLLYVLSRYYLSRDALNELRQQLDADTCTMTLEELKEQLKQHPFYEEIRPANMNILWKKYLPLGIVAFAIIFGYLVIQAIMAWS